MNADELFGSDIWGEPLGPPFDPAAVRPGSLDARVLGQDRWWVDATGAPHHLGDLSAGWAANVVAHLYRRACEMHAVEAVCEALGVDVSAAGHAMWRAALTAAGGRAAPIAAVDPYDWLESQPLIRALRRRHPGIAPPPVLRAWAERAGAASAADPDAALPQDRDQRWST